MMDMFRVVAAMICFLVLLVREVCNAGVATSLHCLKQCGGTPARVRYSAGDCASCRRGYLPPKYKHDPDIILDNEDIGIHPCD